MRALGPVAPLPAVTPEILLDELNDFGVGSVKWALSVGPSVDAHGVLVTQATMQVLFCLSDDIRVTVRLAHGGYFVRTAWFDSAPWYAELPVAEVSCFYFDRFEMMRELNELLSQMPDAGPV